MSTPQGHPLPRPRFTRAPEHDRRIGRGDDFAGDAWRDNRTQRITYAAVGHGPALPAGPCPGNQAAFYQVNACFTNPSADHDWRANLADFAQEQDRSLAKAQVMRFHRQGYWVEVFNQRGELIGGPYDPDCGLPRFIF